MGDNINTIEEAREEILRLHGQLDNLTAENDTLSQNNKALSADVERLRTINQNFYNRLTAQYQHKDKPEEPETPVLSCVDFAKTIQI